MQACRKLTGCLGISELKRYLDIVQLIGKPDGGAGCRDIAFACGEVEQLGGGVVRNLDNSRGALRGGSKSDVVTASLLSKTIF